jgi:hypothetical protein
MKSKFNIKQSNRNGQVMCLNKKKLEVKQVFNLNL